VYGFRFDFVAHPDFAGLPEWVLVLVEVLFREAVDMRVGILFIFADHASTDSDVTIRIVRVDYRECDSCARLQVLRFYAAAGGVDADFSVGVVKPDRGDLRGIRPGITVAMLASAFLPVRRSRNFSGICLEAISSAP